MEIDQDLQKAEDADTAYMGTFTSLANGEEPQVGLKLTTSTSDDREEFSKVFDEVEPSSAPPVKQAEPVKQAAPVKFGDAFRKARMDGLKVFEWNGKKYTTQMKGEVASRPRVARPAAQPMATSAPPILAPTEPKRSAIKPLLNQALPSSPPEKPSPSRRGLSEQHIRDRQDAYDQWQAAKSENRTWYGGRAQPKPGMLEREQQAEKRFSELLSNPR
jgi:hypothetical protein